MLPISFYYLPNSGYINSIYSGELGNISSANVFATAITSFFFSVFVFFADLENLVFGQFTRGILTSIKMRLSALFGLVLIVVISRSSKKMLGIHTGTIVTFMENTILNISKGKKPSQPMNEPLFALKGNFTVSIFVPIALELNTPRGHCLAPGPEIGCVRPVSVHSANVDRKEEEVKYKIGGVLWQ